MILKILEEVIWAVVFSCYIVIILMPIVAFGHFQGIESGLENAFLNAFAVIVALCFGLIGGGILAVKGKVKSGRWLCVLGIASPFFSVIAVKLCILFFT